jgi:hypothetical protein
MVELRRFDYYHTRTNIMLSDVRLHRDSPDSAHVRILLLVVIPSAYNHCVADNSKMLNLDLNNVASLEP